MLRGIRTIKSLCAEDEAVKRHGKHTANGSKYGHKIAGWMAMQFWPTFFATYANMALTFWVGIKFYAQGTGPDISGLVVVLFSVLIVLAGIGTIFTPIQYIQKASTASIACFNIIDAPKIKQGGLKPPHVQADDDITFENVHFAYPSRPQAEILKGLSFAIPSAKVTAFVGQSGCGKSTIVALLERWYDLSEVNVMPTPAEDKDKVASKSPRKFGKWSRKSQEEKSSEKEAPVLEKASDTESEVQIYQNSGSISIGTNNLEIVDRKWWRSQIGLVQQEPVLFNETIFESVARGLVGSQWEKSPDDEKLELVKAACRETFADPFIQRLPNGYQTQVGESGIKLSGGQRQRLAIARSIIKQPKILILDEATSSIDVQGEKLVAAALERASRGRTTVVIAHRLSTIRKADHIIVLREGVAVEEGNHDSLMSRTGGVYSNLVGAQRIELGGRDDDPAAVVDAERQEEHEALDNAISARKDVRDPANPLDVGVKGFANSLGFLLYEQRRHYLIYIFILLSSMGAGAGTALQAWLFSQIISVFQNIDLNVLQAQGSHWALMLFVLAIAAAVCYGTIGFFSSTLAVHVSSAYRTSYFDDVLRKPIHWFDMEGRSFGTLTGQLGSDPQQLFEVLGPSMVFPIIAIFSLLGCTIISFYFGWKLSLVIFFAALPVILMAAFFRVRYEKQFEAMNAKVFAESSQFAAESITAFRTVASLTLEESILARYEKLLASHVHAAFLKGRLSVLVFSLSDSLELTAMALGFWYGGQLMASREYNPLQFFVIYAAIIQGGQAAGQFLAIGPNLANATAAANRILAFRNGSEPVVADSKLLSNHGNDSAGGLEIEFRDVAFRYPTRELPVYRSLSFRIQPGQYVGIVGPSGCGKTTVISLLERFYDISKGAILIDGEDLSDLPLRQYRTLCALVTQEPTVFEGSIRDNLTLGLGYAATQDDIDGACRSAEIYDFITSLSAGFDTRLAAGTHTSLSGGQKQRLCIARALLRKPRLLMLDEATNSLDSVSEALVQRSIENVARSQEGKGMTIVAVAHRLATVRNADRILVLGEGGRLVEDGSHGELLGRRGVYWEMCKAQALDQ